MSNANLAITTAGQADSSLAMILATAGAMIDEINPAMKTIKEGLKGNVLKTEIPFVHGHRKGGYIRGAAIIP